MHNPLIKHRISPLPQSAVSASLKSDIIVLPSLANPTGWNPITPGPSRIIGFVDHIDDESKNLNSSTKAVCTKNNTTLAFDMP